MKTKLFLFVAILLLATSCSNDDDNYNELNGTVWVNYSPEYDETLTITFQSTTFTVKDIFSDDNKKDEKNLVGTYSCSGNSVIMKNSTYSNSGTLDGNKLTLINDDGEPILFNKQVEEELSVNKPLFDTEWVTKLINDNLVATLSFSKTNVTFTQKGTLDGKKIDKSSKGTYVYSEPYVSIVINGETSTFEIKGSEMNINEDGVTIAFEKQ